MTAALKDRAVTCGEGLGLLATAAAAAA